MLLLIIKRKKKIYNVIIYIYRERFYMYYITYVCDIYMNSKRPQVAQKCTLIIGTKTITWKLVFLVYLTQ